MARVASRLEPSARVIVAETEAERELLAFCRRRQQGTLVLNGAYYPVQGDLVVVPQTLSEQGAQRLCVDLTQAAESHERAQARRHRFSSD